MNLDGIAGRALGQRLNGSREREDRLAANDNAASAAKAARVDEGEEAPALANLGCEQAVTTPPALHQRRLVKRDTGRPSGEF